MLILMRTNKVSSQITEIKKEEEETLNLPEVITVDYEQLVSREKRKSEDEAHRQEVREQAMSDLATHGDTTTYDIEGETWIEIADVIRLIESGVIRHVSINF